MLPANEEDLATHLQETIGSSPSQSHAWQHIGMAVPSLTATCSLEEVAHFQHAASSTTEGERHQLSCPTKLQERGRRAQLAQEARLHRGYCRLALALVLGLGAPQAQLAQQACLHPSCCCLAHALVLGLGAQRAQLAQGMRATKL